MECSVEPDQNRAKKNVRELINIDSLFIITLLFSGQTPVHLAVLAGSKDVLKLLNSAGANMSAQV